MSVQTLSFLRTFDGCDFTEWEATARHVINATGCRMALNSKPLIIRKDGVETEESVRTRDNWDNQDAQAHSNLMLRISTDIRDLAVKAGMEHTRDLLDWLKMQYGTTSISAVCTDAAAVDKLQVPGNCDPTPTIDKLLALFMRLEDNNLTYSEPIRAMTLLAKLPPQMEEIARNYDSRFIDATSLTFAAVRNDIIMNWQQRSSRGKQAQPHRGTDAKKLSNVQRKGRDPQFQQQQQLQQEHAPDRLCGKRGGQRRGKQRQQQGHQPQHRPHAQTAQTAATASTSRPQFM